MKASMYKVESGIPIPGMYPFASMNVGDSFELPDPAKRTTVAVAVYRYAKEHGKKFTIRKTPTGELRCWRVA